jgi:predicted secreted hydrolase
MWDQKIEKLLDYLKKHFLYSVCLVCVGFTYSIGMVVLRPFHWRRGERLDFAFYRRFFRRGFENLISAPISVLNSPTPAGPCFERFQNREHALTSWQDKQTEWWYFSGNLYAEDGRHFGYELVFFKRNTHFDYLGFFPGRWLKKNLSVAHFALTNPAAAEKQNRFRYWHRGGFFSRVQSFFSSDFFHVEVSGWSAFEDADGNIHLNAQFTWDSISLRLEPIKELIYNGNQGYSPRCDEEGIASYHCAYTRMKTSGNVMANGEVLRVKGLSWLDHEKMQAGQDRLTNGWDWYSMQLDNHEELMLYLFRNQDGSIDQKYSYGTHVGPLGEVTSLSHNEIIVKTLQKWKSPESRGEYPVKSEVKIPSLDLQLEVSAIVENSELNCISTSFVSYWEGPVRIHGISRDKPVIGSGYLELCGYDRRLSSKLVHSMFAPEPHLIARSLY